MTGLETILISAGSVTLASIGTLLGTARYYQGKVVTKEQCKACRELSSKDEERRGDDVEEVLRQIESLSGKYDRILKILILNVDIPNDLKEKILP